MPPKQNYVHIFLPYLARGQIYAYMFIEPVLCFAKSRTEMSILREFIDIWHPEEHLKSEFFQSV